MKPLKPALMMADEIHRALDQGVHVKPLKPALLMLDELQQAIENSWTGAAKIWVTELRNYLNALDRGSD